jgi:hypothetical protein
MGVVQIKFNGKAVFEAIEQNGVNHLRGDWYGTFGADGKPDQACVLGIAAMHLGVAGFGELSKNEGANLLEQLNQFEVPEDSKWRNESSPLGNTIIHWNDLRGYGTKEYALTWQEVVEMARDLLTPHFDHVFTADKYVFEGEHKYLVDSGAESPEPDEEEDYEYEPYEYEAESQPIW